MENKIAASHRRSCLKIQTALLLLLCISLAVPARIYGQATLKEVQANRFAGQTYLQAEKYDSAGMAISRFIGHEAFVNPYDYVNFALYRYQLKDTAGFLKYLNKGIEGGVDSAKIRSFLRKLSASDQSFLGNYLMTNYESLRRKGWCKYDTALIKEANSIAALDQYARDALMKLTAGKADAAYSYLACLQQQADSMNYVRITRLLESGKFPGYHNCGAFASLTIVLIHSGDYHEGQWDHLFSYLKKEVLAGNILPLELATIADNHYQRGKGKLCSYYGQWTGRTTELCDCKEVDNYRAVIGLPDLQTEYKSKNKSVPECYQAAAQK